MLFSQLSVLIISCQNELCYPCDVIMMEEELCVWVVEQIREADGVNDPKQ